MTTFEVGKTYYTRSICDYDCVWRFKVVKRTKTTITIQEVDCDEHPFDDQVKVRRIYVYSNCENVRPMGSYSMAPVLTAEKIYTSAFDM